MSGLKKYTSTQIIKTGKGRQKGRFENCTFAILQSFPHLVKYH